MTSQPSRAEEIASSASSTMHLINYLLNIIIRVINQILVNFNEGCYPRYLLFRMKV